MSLLLATFLPKMVGRTDDTTIDVSDVCPGNIDCLTYRYEMMMRLSWLVTCLILMSAVSEAEAQRIPGYTRRNTVSPYFNLYRGGAGPTANYFTLVRPMQNQERFNQRQMTENMRLQQQILGGPMSFPRRGGLSFLPPRGLTGPSRREPGPATPQTPSGPTFRQDTGGIGSPSQAATFMNTSHYFPRGIR